MVTGGRSPDAVVSTRTGIPCIVELATASASVGADKIAGNCVRTTQQSVCREGKASICMQQSCALLGLGCRQIPSGAIIIPTRRMAIAAR